jgi:hypothetical protein
MAELRHRRRSAAGEPVVGDADDIMVVEDNDNNYSSPTRRSSDIPSDSTAVLASPSPPHVMMQQEAYRRSSSGHNNDSLLSRPLPDRMTNNNNNNNHSKKEDERKGTRIFKRVAGGVLLFCIFAGLVYAGHLYICALVALVQLLLFRELVRVRYSAYYHRIQDTIPLFRTTQWMWFAVAIFYSYADFVHTIIENNLHMHYLSRYSQYFPSISFCLYSGTFVLTITTLQRDNIKFQINQLCWTTLVLCLIVGQLKYVMHNIFNGLFWFVFPTCLVICNDIMA